jgi:hypothetical protein
MRKHTPPVRSDEPPTARPARMEIIGVCPRPSAIDIPASRNSRRTESLGRKRW